MEGQGFSVGRQRHLKAGEMDPTEGRGVRREEGLAFDRRFLPPLVQREGEEDVQILM